MGSSWSFPLLLAEGTHGYLWHLSAYQSVCWPPGSSVPTHLFHVSVHSSLLGLPSLTTAPSYDPATPAILSLCSLFPVSCYSSCRAFSHSFSSLQDSRGHVQSAAHVSFLFSLLQTLPDASGYILSLIHVKNLLPINGVAISVFSLLHPFPCNKILFLAVWSSASGPKSWLYAGSLSGAAYYLLVLVCFLDLPPHLHSPCSFHQLGRDCAFHSNITRDYCVPNVPSQPFKGHDLLKHSSQSWVLRTIKGGLFKDCHLVFWHKMLPMCPRSEDHSALVLSKGTELIE